MLFCILYSLLYIVHGKTSLKRYIDPNSHLSTEQLDAMGMRTG